MRAPSLPWRCWCSAHGWTPEVGELHKATLVEAPTAREAAIAFALERFAGGDGVVTVVPADQGGRWRMESEWLVCLDDAPHPLAMRC